MNILLISNVFPPGFIGGYELGAFEIAKGLQESGHDVSVLTTDYFQDDSPTDGGLRVDRSLSCTYVSHQLSGDPNSVARLEGVYVHYANIRKIGNALRRGQTNVVFLFNLMGMGALGIIGFLQACAVPVVLYLMDNIFIMVDRNSPGFARYESIFGQPGFEKTTRIIAMSRNVVREINWILGSPLPDVVYVPGWTYASNAVEPKPGAENAKTRFVVCSRIAPHKGTELIVDAAEELVRRGETRFTIDVFGAGQAGPFLQRVQSKGLNGHIRYLGRKEKSEILALFADYDALLFPTWEREAFGFTVPEAAGAGCFPIMTAGIGATEWFVDNVDCMKIGRTADDLAEAMYRAICLEPADRYAMRCAAAATARRYMTFDRWLKVIEGVCDEAGTQRDALAIQRSRSVEAAFLMLSELWREGL